MVAAILFIKSSSLNVANNAVLTYKFQPLHGVFGEPWGTFFGWTNSSNSLLAFSSRFLYSNISLVHFRLCIIDFSFCFSRMQFISLVSYSYESFIAWFCTFSRLCLRPALERSQTEHADIGLSWCCLVLWTFLDNRFPFCSIFANLSDNHLGAF